MRKEEIARVKQAAELIGRAPDLAELQQDPTALEAHLDALVRTLCHPDFYAEVYEPRRQRCSAEGDAGKAAMAELAAQLHAALEIKDKKLEVDLTHVDDLFHAFKDGSKLPKKPPPATTESNGFSGRTYALLVSEFLELMCPSQIRLSSPRIIRHCRLETVS